MENPGKLERLRGTTASFGTIGDTPEERLEFWELVHKHEAKDGRTQFRLVLELPHEANAQARHEIVRRYTEEFRQKGIPFWVSIHAPTKQNDYRNHHAHVVFIDRPASRMTDPGTGKMAWDFTVGVKVKKASRNVVIRYPYRQNLDPEMRDRGYIKRSRARFSEITNDVMDRHGLDVRYDPRSYKDMGLDVTPMAHVARILADKSNTQQFVVMDPEWTHRMVNQEMRATALRRDETYQALRATEERLQQTARHIHKMKANATLPRHMRLPEGHVLTTRIAGALTTKMMEIERERLAERFFDEAFVRTLTHVIDATTPKVHSRGPAKVYDPSNAPDPQDLANLNQAALEELAAFRIGQRLRGQSFRLRRNMALDQWRDAGRPFPVAASQGATGADRTNGARSQALTVMWSDKGRERTVPPPPPPSSQQSSPDRGTRHHVPSFGRTPAGQATPFPQPPTFAQQIAAGMTAMTDAIRRDAQGPWDVARAASDFTTTFSGALKAMRATLDIVEKAQATAKAESKSASAATDAGRPSADQVPHPAKSGAAPEGAAHPPPREPPRTPAPATAPPRAGPDGTPGSLRRSFGYGPPTDATGLPPSMQARSQQPATLPSRQEPPGTTGSSKKPPGHAAPAPVNATAPGVEQGKEAEHTVAAGRSDPRSATPGLRRAEFTQKPGEPGSEPTSTPDGAPGRTRPAEENPSTKSLVPSVGQAPAHGGSLDVRAPGEDAKARERRQHPIDGTSQQDLFQSQGREATTDRSRQRSGRAETTPEATPQQGAQEKATKGIDGPAMTVEERERRKRRRAILARRRHDDRGMDI